MRTQTSKTLKVALAAATALARRKVALALCVALCAVGLAFPHGDDNATIISFDPPGSIFTEPNAINPAGAIAGFYADASNVYHSFLRAPDGPLTSFDAPGAGTAAFQGTLAWSINPAGAIALLYTDASYAAHGFLRAPDGTITVFDFPGSTNTAAYNINPAGAIAGRHRDTSMVRHGFLRTPDGTMTTFDAPDAGTDSG